jgi:hypothetical protein
MTFRSVYNISSIDLPSYSTSIEEEDVLIGAAGVSIGAFDAKEAGVSRALRLTFDSVLPGSVSVTGGAVLETPLRPRVLIPEGAPEVVSGGGADTAPTLGGVAGDEVAALPRLPAASGGDLLRVVNRSGVVPEEAASARVADLDRPPPVIFEIKPPTTLKTADMVAIYSGEASDVSSNNMM